MKPLKFSLFLKLITIISIVTASSFAFFIYQTIEDERVDILNERLKASELMSQSILHSVYTDMPAGRADLVRYLMLGLRRIKGVERVQIVRKNGYEEAFQDMKTLKAVEKRVGHLKKSWFMNHPMKKDATALGIDAPAFKEALGLLKQGARNYSYSERVNGKRLLTYVTRIEAKKVCARCHGSGEALRGYIVISTSLEDAYLKLSADRNRWIFYGISMFILVFIIIFIFLKRFLVRPINGMIDISKKWSMGDLDSRMKVESSDELGVLGEAFNYMASSLKTSRDEIIEGKAHIEAMLKGIADGVIFADAENRVTFINDAAERIFDIKEEDWLERDFKDAHSAHAHREALKMIKDMRQGKVSSVSREIKTDEKIIDAHFSPVMHNTEYLGVIFIARDITETKRLQAELLKAEKLAVVGRMSSHIAHEIRNPLVPIGGFARLIRRKLGKDSPLIKYADIIVKEIDRLERLLHNVLYYTKEIKPSFKTVSVNDIIKDTLTLYKDVFVDKKIEVNVSLSEDMPDANIDPSFFKEAVINIMINAINAMPDGGTLAIESRSFKKKGHPSIAVSIKDTGMGIPEEIRKNIFEPFFTTRIHGMGLGLSLARKIVNIHGGEIEVESMEGKGTQFIITLPVGVKG